MSHKHLLMKSQLFKKKREITREKNTEVWRVHPHANMLKLLGSLPQLCQHLREFVPPALHSSCGSVVEWENLLLLHHDVMVLLIKLQEIGTEGLRSGGSIWWQRHGLRRVEAPGVAVTLWTLIHSSSSQLLGVKWLQGMQSVDFSLVFWYLLPKIIKFSALSI